MSLIFQPADSDPEVMLRFAVSDSLENIARVLSWFPVSEPAALAELDSLLATSQERGEDPISVLLGSEQRPNAPLTAALLVMVTVQWMRDVLKGGFDWPLVALEQCWETGKPAEPGVSEHRLELIFGAMIPMAELKRGRPLRSEHLIEIGDAFLALAKHLAEHDEARAALGCAESAAHFFGTIRETMRTLEAGRFALAQAQKLDEAGMIMGELARVAHTLSQLADTDASRRLEAFDAWERALRFASLRPEHSDQVLKIAITWVKKPWLRVLRPFLWSLWPAEERREVSEMTEEGMIALRGLCPIWGHDAETVGGNIRGAGQAAQIVENERLALQPLPAKSIATASWATFDFSHSLLRRAVPHSRSILLEEHRDDLLVLLTHETTHVMSMLGRVGMASWALRWAMFELEVRLWSSGVSPDEESPHLRLFEGRRPATLRPLEQTFQGVAPAAGDLARAEQQLEVARKLQLLENIWAPWFEGLAVFAELGADPRMDVDSFSVVSGVMVNVVDVMLKQEAEKRGCDTEEACRQLWAEGEARLGHAQERVGTGRYWHYLDERWEKYLAGTLAVRAVVSSWRRTLGQPISGAEAFAPLLHATRYAAANLIPDPALPVEEFRRQVVARQLEWLRDISTVPREDLELLVTRYAKTGDDEGGFVWKGNRVEWIPPERVKEFDVAPPILQFMARARRSQPSLQGDLGRVEGSPVLLTELLEHVTTALEEAADGCVLLNEDLIHRLMAARHILPIGRAECPYWLAPEGKAIYCLFRTREKSADTGEPGYNAVYFPLPPEKYDALEKQVRRGAPGRLKVTRVAWLANLDDDLTAGRNFFVFQTDDWLHVENAGLAFHSTGVPPQIESAIKIRLDPPDFLAAQEAIVAADHPLVRRTLEWVQSHDWLWSEKDEGWDLRPWAERVAGLAQEILAADEVDDAREISAGLIRFILGEGAAADHLAREGLKPLADAEIDLPLLIRVLDASARSPVAAGAAETQLVEAVKAAGFPLLSSGALGVDFAWPASPH